MKIHKLSEVKSNKTGKGTTAWQYSIILSGATIGKDFNICPHYFIENNVVIGDRVAKKNSFYLLDSTYLENDVFIFPNVTFANVIYPRSVHTKNFSKIIHSKNIISEGASIGGGTTILPGIRIEKKQ